MRKQRWEATAWVAAALAMALAALPGAAGQLDGSAPGTLGGVVLGLDGKPAAGVSVIVQASDGSHPKAVKTNDQGRFWFPLLRPGPYEVRAQAKGLSSDWKHNQPVRSGHQTNLTLRLLPRKQPASKPRRVPPSKPAAPKPTQ